MLTVVALRWTLDAAAGAVGGGAASGGKSVVDDIPRGTEAVTCTGGFANFVAGAAPSAGCVSLSPEALSLNVAGEVIAGSNKGGGSVFENSH